MSIITPIDFKGEALIAQIEQVFDEVQSFIDKYEPKFLKELLGLTLYQEFIDGITPVEILPPTVPPTYEPIDPKWVSLRDETELKSMIVGYVYWFYQANNITSTVGTGEGKLRKDNAAAASPLQKMVYNWNEMVKNARLFDLSTDTYPDWKRVYWRDWYCGCNWHLPEIYVYKNQLGL